MKNLRYTGGKELSQDDAGEDTELKSRQAGSRVRATGYPSLTITRGGWVLYPVRQMKKPASGHSPRAVGPGARIRLELKQVETAALSLPGVSLNFFIYKMGILHSLWVFYADK